MSQAADVVLSLILGLVGLCLTAGAIVEHAAVAAMTTLGLAPAVQRPLLIVVGLLLLAACLRLFGRLIGVLLAIFLLLVLLHVLMPGLAVPQHVQV